MQVTLSCLGLILKLPVVGGFTIEVTPLPAVVTAVALRYQEYGVRDENANLLFCWISVEKGTIYAFVAPALLIILINVVFLCFVVRSLWKSKQRHWSTQDLKKETKIITLAKTTFKATVILLPLLGLTWVFGVLTIDRNTTVFAWLFTICNSIQDVVILFFHVIRNERVWSKLCSHCISAHQKTLSSTARFQKYEAEFTLKSGTPKTKKEKKLNDFEMNTLPSSTNEGAKFTSVVRLELEYEVPKLSLNKRKVVEIISNPSADDSPETKATQTGITMENISYGTLWRILTIQ